MKRATIDDYAAHGDYDISIHALVKRATEKIVTTMFTSMISIHALVKRATGPQYVSVGFGGFQSTPS